MFGEIYYSLCVDLLYVHLKLYNFVLFLLKKAAYVNLLACNHL